MITSRAVVRPATEADLPALGRLGATLVQLHHEFDSARFIAAPPQTEVKYAEFLQSQLANPDAVVLVADCDGVVAGYTFAVLEGFDYMALRGPAAVGQDLIVDPAYRGRGIGRALLDAVVAAMRERGAPRIVLSAAERNGAARRLFADAGFRPTMVEMTREL